MAANQRAKNRKKKKPDKEAIEAHYVANAQKKSVTADIFDYQDSVLEEISLKTRHKKRSVLIAIVDYFIVSEKEWLRQLNVNYPRKLKNMSLETLIERFGFSGMMQGHQDRNKEVS
ncbi:MAG: hypothetical protein ACE5JB_15625 [bacterium]